MLVFEKLGGRRKGTKKCKAPKLAINKASKRIILEDSIIIHPI